MASARSPATPVTTASRSSAGMTYFRSTRVSSSASALSSSRVTVGSGATASTVIGSPSRRRSARPAGWRSRRGGVVHLDRRRVVDQVDAQRGHPGDPGVEEQLETLGEGGLVGEGGVEHDDLVPAGARGRSAAVRDGENRDQTGHQRHRQHDVGGAEAADQPDRQGGEVVGDLVLAELVGAQPDDRQHAEEAQPQADRRGAARQHDRDRQDTDVDGDEGGDEVGPAVAGVVDGQGEDEDGDQVGAGEEVGEHGRRPCRAGLSTT